MKKLTISAALAFAWCASAADAVARPVVVELFTSQGCSSCPPADALLKQLADDPSILALSFHVHYWDYLGWQDPFASQENTGRQRAYAALHQHHSIFTPEMVIDGSLSVVGSNRRQVEQALAEMRKDMQTVPVSVAPQGKN